jgi:predicted DNA-binding transcriptional regulator AlpA
MSSSSKLKDTPEAAQYLNLGVSTLNKLRLVGAGPAYIKMGARVGYLEADLDRYIAQCRQKSTAQNKSVAAVRDRVAS